jgi:hypothetical protein
MATSEQFQGVRKHIPTLMHGQRIRVIQSIRTREGEWTTDVDGEVVSCGPHPTGSWFAHGKGDKLWLQRVRLRKYDGELVDLTIDEASEVTVLAPPPAKA